MIPAPWILTSPFFHSTAVIRITANLSLDEPVGGRLLDVGQFALILTRELRMLAFGVEFSLPENAIRTARSTFVVVDKSHSFLERF